MNFSNSYHFCEDCHGEHLAKVGLKKIITVGAVPLKIFLP